jgi:hypothetical protein
LTLTILNKEFNKKIFDVKGNDLKFFWVAREMTHATREIIKRIEICSKYYSPLFSETLQSKQQMASLSPLQVTQ